MKRIISMLVVICLVAAMMPVAFAETVTETIYSENFDSGVFTVVANDTNTEKALYKDGNTTGFTFVKVNGKAFADTFPETVVSHSDITGNNVLLTTGYEMGGLTADALYLNLPKKTTGTITVEYRLRRPAGSGDKAWTYLLGEGVNGTDLGDYLQYFELYRSSSTTRFRPDANYYVDASTKSSKSYQDKSGVSGFVYMKNEINLDEQTISTWYAKSEGAYSGLGSNIKWYANGEAGSYYMADGFAGILFTSNEVLGIDELTVTHTYEKEDETPVTEVEGLTINADGTVSSTATFNYLDGDVAPKTARLVTAFYKEDGQLITVKSDTKTVDSVTTSQTLTTPAIALPADTKYIKAFVWDFSTLKPYATTQYTVE